MTIDEAHELADDIERHKCLHVELLFNACGMLRELGIEPPAFSMHSRSWLILVAHDGESGRHVYGADHPHASAEWRALDRIEDALIMACWNAMARYDMHGIVDSGGGTEREEADWRCPVHEGGANGERGAA